VFRANYGTRPARMDTPQLEDAVEEAERRLTKARDKLADCREYDETWHVAEWAYQLGWDAAMEAAATAQRKTPVKRPK